MTQLPHHSLRWWTVMAGHRSMMRMRMPLSAWYSSAAPEQDLHHPADRAGVERQQLVVGVRVAAREVDVDDVQDDERQTAMPLMRWNIHAQLPSRPR